MDKFQKLREENPVFIYKSCTIADNGSDVDVSYEFVFPGLAAFRPGWSFTKPASYTGNAAEGAVFQRLAFSLGMAEAVSYWKAACSPRFIVECGTLSPEQADWWKKLYFNGLGEFFYINNISADPDSFVQIECTQNTAESPEMSEKELKGCLVPIGGGKDSALTIETLVSAGMECKCYSINSRRSVQETVRAAGLPEESLITSKRRFDRSLIELNNKGYLNGHTPFSAIVAFSAEITAYLNGLKYVVLSNESSANESTVAGMSVNHQYSKSFEFERDFHCYEEKFLKSGVYYFSFLRPLSEFQIAEMFVTHKKYLDVFRSCNLGSKVSPDIWCGNCPKCLFVFLILSPFADCQKLTEIFGKNLLDEAEMLEYFRELTGQTEHKPFECVGSVDEVNLAASMTVQRLEAAGRQLPLLLREYRESILYKPETINKRLEICHSHYDSNNLLPAEFEAILKNEMERIL